MRSRWGEPGPEVFPLGHDPPLGQITEELTALISPNKKAVEKNEIFSRQHITWITKEENDILEG